MSDIDNQDLYEGTGSDTPLIDSLGSAVKRLIDKGKSRGYITVEELNRALPPEYGALYRLCHVQVATTGS